MLIGQSITISDEILCLFIGEESIGSTTLRDSQYLNGNWRDAHDKCTVENK